MQADKEAWDYIEGLQEALRDCNVVLWAMVKSCGGRVEIRKELMTLFQPETSVLHRWTEFEGEVFSVYPRKDITLPDGTKKEIKPN